MKTLTERGFGFLFGDDGREYFFHRSGVVDDLYDQLREGEAMEFDVVPNSPKGPRADAVKRRVPAAT